MFDHVSLDMSKYYQQDFDGFLESFKEEVDAQLAMMKILDEQIIYKDLPPVGRTRDLFRMIDTIGYAADHRYKKKNNIVENDFDYVTYFKKEDMLNEMRNILREEVAAFFSRDKAND
jgi:hypothetical protein